MKELDNKSSNETCLGHRCLLKSDHQSMIKLDSKDYGPVLAKTNQSNTHLYCVSCNQDALEIGEIDYDYQKLNASNDNLMLTKLGQDFESKRNVEEQLTNMKNSKNFQQNVTYLVPHCSLKQLNLQKTFV